MLVVNSPTFRGFCPGLFAVALVFVCNGMGLGAQQAGQNELELQGDQKRVLVLYSTGREAVISVTGERDLPRALDRGLGRHLDFHSEYLDAGRFPDPQYQAAFRDFLRLKYGGQRFDAVIPVLDVAVQFIAKYRDELFPGTPIVYLARSKTSSPIPNSDRRCVRGGFCRDRAAGDGTCSPRSTRSLSSAEQPHAIASSSRRHANSSGGFSPDWRSRTCRGCRR